MSKKYLIPIVILVLIIGVSFAFMQEDNAKKPKQVKKQIVKKTIKKPAKKKVKKPTITFVGKPSCRSCCKQKYIWRKNTFVNYCPNCKHYGTLLINPKGVPERELTCKRCNSDFCICGHDKTSGRRHYNSILSKPK